MAPPLYGLMAPRAPTVEERLARIAESAHGVVTRQQLLRAGIREAQLEWRLATGALLREHPGIYRVGHRAPSVEARYLSAVWAVGPGAVLSGRAAAYMLGLMKSTPPPPPEVTTPCRRRARGVIVHRARRRVEGTDARVWRQIPVTTPARTVVDLAAGLDEAELARVCHEAGVRYGLTPRQVEMVLANRPTSPGAGKLRRILHGDVPVTLSRLEERFLELLRDADLPLPRMNRPAGGRRVDCRWPAHGLTVEIDSYQFHRSRHAWEQDRRREREAHARGDDFRRYTYGDVMEAPTLMLRELGQLLAGGCGD